MGRLGIALAAVALILTSLCAGQSGTASASSGSWVVHLPAVTPHHGDWFTEAINAYDQTAPDGSTDLVVALEESFGPGLIGGSPSFVNLLCEVLHHWNPAGGGSFTTAEEGIVLSVVPGTPPPSYLSGYGQVSGADVFTGTSTSVYSALAVGGEDPSTFSYGLLAPPGYVQGTAMSAGWQHYNDVTHTRYADSGPVNISLRGVMEFFTFPPGSPTFASGAVQCQLGSQPTDLVGAAFVSAFPLNIAGSP